jgi:hypothetical protein
VQLAKRREALKGMNMASIWDGAPKNSKAVFEHLKVLASRMRVATYGEIALAIGEQEGRTIAPVSLNLPLGFIRDNICRKRGLPWLNALAVNAEAWLPGDSFLPTGVAFGEDDRVLWRGAVLAVFGYPWDTVEVD